MVPACEWGSEWRQSRKSFRRPCAGCATCLGYDESALAAARMFCRSSLIPRATQSDSTCDQSVCFKRSIEGAHHSLHDPAWIAQRGPRLSHGALPAPAPVSSRRHGVVLCVAASSLYCGISSARCFRSSACSILVGVLEAFACAECLGYRDSSRSRGCHPRRMCGHHIGNDHIRAWQPNDQARTESAGHNNFQLWCRSVGLLSYENPLQGLARTLATFGIHLHRGVACVVEYLPFKSTTRERGGQNGRPCT